MTAFAELQVVANPGWPQSLAHTPIMSVGSISTVSGDFSCVHIILIITSSAYPSLLTDTCPDPISPRQFKPEDAETLLSSDPAKRGVKPNPG